MCASYHLIFLPKEMKREGRRTGEKTLTDSFTKCYYNYPRLVEELLSGQIKELAMASHTYTVIDFSFQSIFICKSAHPQNYFNTFIGKSLSCQPFSQTHLRNNPRDLDMLAAGTRHVPAALTGKVGIELLKMHSGMSQAMEE